MRTRLLALVAVAVMSLATALPTAAGAATTDTLNCNVTVSSAFGSFQYPVSNLQVDAALVDQALAGGQITINGITLTAAPPSTSTNTFTATATYPTGSTVAATCTVS
jgi:hypothetical protein